MNKPWLIFSSSPFLFVLISRFEIYEIYINILLKKSFLKNLQIQIHKFFQTLLEIFKRKENSQIMQYTEGMKNHNTGNHKTFEMNTFQFQTYLMIHVGARVRSGRLDGQEWFMNFDFAIVGTCPREETIFKAARHNSPIDFVIASRLLPSMKFPRKWSVHLSSERRTEGRTERIFSRG